MIFVSFFLLIKIKSCSIFYKWLESRAIGGLDLHPDGEVIAAIARDGEFFIADVSTNKFNVWIQTNTTSRHSNYTPHLNFCVFQII